MYNRESKIMRKLLGKAAPDSATGDLSSIAGTTTSSIPPSFRPSKSQDAVFSAGAPISCFDVSSDRRAVILAGPHILKTVVLDDPASSSFIFNDGIDVRTAITTRQSTGSRTNVIADQLNIRDVKWHSGSHIYTACASGKVFSYDLTRLGAGEAEPFDYILMHEDSRQMNSLDINPHLQSWLLTGGQDGTARVFDSNSPAPARHGVTFRQRFAPLRCIDPIRQVSWSPKQGHEMACCTDSGVVMKWDVRQPSRPVLRINAHEKACSTIAWHIDGLHLLSAGWDTKIHIWDLGNSADKRQKPKWTISAPAPVAAVAWRPGLWSASAQARRVAQVAVTYDETSNRKYGTSAVHIWDFARPSMPYKELEIFETSPSAIRWQDQDMLWTVGQDGAFHQSDVAFARKVIDRQSTSAMALSPRGDAFLFLDERSNSHRPRFHGTHPTEMIHRDRATYGSSLSNPGLSLSRSDSEDDVLGSFLGPRRRVTGKRRLSGRGGVPLSTTPPSGGASFLDDLKQNLGLEQSINVTGTFKPQQAMSFGHIPAAVSVQVYHFMSSAYLDTIKMDLPYVEGGKHLIERVGDMMEQFAKTSELANLYRLAQTWRILAYAMNILLKRRAQYHFEVRVGRFQKMHLDDGSRGSDRSKPSDMYGNGDDAPRRPSAQRGSVDSRFHSIRSLLAEEIESTSNVPTPVARPADSSSRNINTGDFGHEEMTHPHGKRLSPIMEPESLHLGPAAHGSLKESKSPRKRLDSEPISVGSGRTGESDTSYTEGYDFYDAEVLAKAIDVPMTGRRNGGGGLPYRGRTIRHDSDESLGQMFSISSGTRRSGRMGSSGDAFARPGLIREQSDLERESGASSQESPVVSKTLADQNGRSSRPRDSTTEEVFMISQTTKTDESYTSQQSSTLKDKDGDDSNVSPRNSFRGIDNGWSVSPKKKEPMSPRHDPRPHIVETDYLPWSHDPPYPHPLSTQDWRGGAVSSKSPLDPYSLVRRALDFESKTSALHASAIILLLKPLVPDSVIDSHRATAILRQHHRRLMQMSLFVEAALLRNMCVQGWPDGLPDWGENYTSVFSGAQQGGKVGLFCSSCRKPREVDPRAGAEAVWSCERCGIVMAPCSVCGHREAVRPSHIPAEIVPSSSDVESEMWLSEWWYCPGCAHGGHASCLQLWHGASETASLADPCVKYSDGCCPSDGCGHACLPGKYRGETTTARSDELGRAALDSSRAREERNKPGSRGGSRRSSPGAPFERSVRSDGNDVPQSKAVGMAREALNKGSGGGILSSSPGRTISTTGDRERRKSVKFARQDHE
ncbi:hypothetical protein C2857_007767 [Epichloe festucae Fl1]|uniref:WD repeat protein n=1 Tax=Epichloe festucae (strain Fl1) TaxID=877507 RepID=A0A7S9KMU5_EPIFF|nr:hypothetical protein C2857_007767 [Epichloe festucae Fl1]